MRRQDLRRRLRRLRELLDAGSPPPARLILHTAAGPDDEACKRALGSTFPVERFTAAAVCYCPACKAAGGDELTPEDLAILKAAGLRPEDIPRILTESELL